MATVLAPSATGILDPHTGKPVGADDSFYVGVNNELADPIEVTLEGAEPLSVGPGETGRMRLEGRRKGQYVVDFGAAGQALLVTGAKPGP